MLNAGNPIGVMDSGIGGLTVVRELQRILPGEDIIYFGDSANCPYGNKTSDQIFELSSHMLQFLGDNGVKCTAIACNTISTMADRLRPCFDYKIVSIVEEAAKYVLREHLKSVGLIATEFTVASGQYAELIHEGDPECKVVGKGSPLLAALVDRGDFNQHDINTEIRTQVDNILAREKVENLILGCTIPSWKRTSTSAIPKCTSSTPRSSRQTPSRHTSPSRTRSTRRKRVNSSSARAATRRYMSTSASASVSSRRVI